MNRIIICIIILLCHHGSDAQLTGIAKLGLNIGNINQDWWTFQDSIKYVKPLIRPVISVGAQLSISKRFFLRQELMFQLKGQGTKTPDVRSAFRTNNPDVLRFMSFPLSINGKIIPHVFAGLSIQPSIYLSGTDNYRAKEIWHGWIWGSSISLKHIRDVWEFGIEYDHDFTLYYCPGCDIRFYTFRLYGAYHFIEK